MNLQKEIYNYLKSQSLMSISTIGDDMWPAIVYYLVDKNLDLYFVSDKNDTHSKNIKQNNNVTCAIYDSTQTFAGDLIGIQLKGKVVSVNSFTKTKIMLKMWNKTIAKKRSLFLDINNFKKAKDSRVYKVTPEKIKFFNTKLFPKENFKIFEF